MFALLHTQPRWYHYVFLSILAFSMRAATFYFFVQHEERYCQPDSNDYHYGALCIAYGYGMHNPDGRPIFWRTPGYPWYLSKFYRASFDYAQDERRKQSPLILSSSKNAQQVSPQFSDHRNAQVAAIWTQIILSSFLPLLVFWLALTLTNTLSIAWVAALISIVHLGFVLASTFLLTDGLAILLFTLFLIFWYRSFQLPGEIAHKNIKHPFINLLLAVISLSLYTWMRPMGQFVALVAAIVILLFGDKTWKGSIKRALFFITLFALTLLPWFWRNYQLTDRWFFCPLSGLYLNAFSAPKILARVEHIPLADAHKKLNIAASECIRQEYMRRHATGYHKFVCNELECMHTAWPLIAAHPGYFIYDWMVEVCKTTFDLYASQLVAFAGNCFKWDPLIEYLDEKIKLCLYKQPMSWHMRIIAWIEFLFSLFLWVGIFGGMWTFILQPIINKSWKMLHTYGFLWIKTGLIIGLVVMQTGGFGYARLRLPVESLMLILGITFWWWIYTQQRKKTA